MVFSKGEGARWRLVYRRHDVKDDPNKLWPGTESAGL